mgnify:CR=1 FL=1
MTRAALLFNDRTLKEQLVEALQAEGVKIDVRPIETFIG